MRKAGRRVACRDVIPYPVAHSRRFHGETRSAAAIQQWRLGRKMAVRHRPGVTGKAEMPAAPTGRIWIAAGLRPSQ